MERKTEKMAANANLHKAKDVKNDEFYTQLTDVAKELMHYKTHFKDKIVELYHDILHPFLIIVHHVYNIIFRNDWNTKLFCCFVFIRR